MQVSGFPFLRIKKAYQWTLNEFLWLLMLYWDLMKRNDWSVQETEHYLQHYVTVIQSLRQTVRSDVQFVKESFFWTGSFEWTSWSSSSNRTEHLKQFMARVAQIYKFNPLNQNSLSDTWQSLRLEMSQNSGIYDPVMNESFR